jgi:tRNA U34 5-methylaminomethyl-2-thiouridine-forming methyltransferase MnmC
MWEPSIFEKMAQLMDEGGVLVTYCAKGQVRRNLEAAGFNVERLKGPPGKREMLRATKC